MRGIALNNELKEDRNTRQELSVYSIRKYY